MKIRYLAVARAEINDAAEYYDAISPRLGNGFKHELMQLVRLTVKMPLAWPPMGSGVRTALMTRFPFVVIYAPGKLNCW